MLRDRAARRRGVTFAILLAICLMLLGVGRSAPAEELRSGVNFALAPIRDALASSTRSLADVIGAITEIDQMRRENQDMSVRLEQLEQEVAQLEAVRVENLRLARLLKTQKSLDHQTVAAQVIARGATQFERVITLDRGEEAGIELRDAVLSEGGALAGSVVEVGQGYSAVRLLNDTRSLVIGQDVKSRATGEVTGRLSAPLAMGDIPIDQEVAVGDRIVTAGIDLGRRFKSAFPKNLLIGEIVDVQQDPGAVVQTALVQPAAELDTIEEVLVITDYAAPQPPVTATDEES